MSAKNIYHDAVREALVADGWTVTDDPLSLQYVGRDLFIDLGAEQSTLSAERGTERIAVEIQSFRGASDVRNLEEALGQFMIYRHVLSTADPSRELLMAVAEAVYNDFLSHSFGQSILAAFRVPLIVFDPVTRRINKWNR